MSTEPYASRAQIKRGRKRASYDIELAKKIIDCTLMCHIAQSVDNQAFITPTCHWRDGGFIYWHGHAKARNAAGSADQQVAINICQLDGLVLARSAFHHSVNYRSVTLFGVPELITEEQEKLRQLKLFVDRVSPERWSQLRPITAQELTMTSVMAMPINEFSIKQRAEPPKDDLADYSWPVWAGVLPLNKSWGQLEQDPQQADERDYSLPIAPEVC